MLWKNVYFLLMVSTEQCFVGLCDIRCCVIWLLLLFLYYVELYLFASDLSWQPGSDFDALVMNADASLLMIHVSDYLCTIIIWISFPIAPCVGERILLLETTHVNDQIKSWQDVKNNRHRIFYAVVVTVKKYLRLLRLTNLLWHTIIRLLWLGCC